MDDHDYAILRSIQVDNSQSLESLSETVALSRNACWRRLKKLEANGVIRASVAILDAEKLGLPLTAYVMVRAGDHNRDWLDAFNKAVKLFPEITGAHRLSGDLDYLIRVVVSDMKAYDAFYQRLISKIELADVSASFVMENIVERTALPI